MSVYILSDGTYATLLEKATDSERLILTMMRDSSQIIVSQYLPEGTQGYIYNGPSLTDMVYSIVPEWPDSWPH